ncbi:MAG: DsbA family oxidoreductase [Pseudomonadota bacterium]
MTTTLTIDFVSDVSCPWCVIGLRGLEQALDLLQGEVEADIRFQPFELNPGMAREGENIGEHIQRKYGSSPEKSADLREMIRSRAATLGFVMAMGPDSRIYNTFDAHRLLHWAGLQDLDRQRALKHALFALYFTDAGNPADRDALIEAAGRVGLDRDQAASILDSDAYADAVREAELLWQRQGISSVPAVVVDGRYLISGGQPPEAFEKALRSIAAEKAAS